MGWGSVQYKIGGPHKMVGWEHSGNCVYLDNILRMK